MPTSPVPPLWSRAGAKQSCPQEMLQDNINQHWQQKGEQRMRWGNPPDNTDLQLARKWVASMEPTFFSNLVFGGCFTLHTQPEGCLGLAFLHVRLLSLRTAKHLWFQQHDEQQQWGQPRGPCHFMAPKWTSIRTTEPQDFAVCREHYCHQTMPAFHLSTHTTLQSTGCGCCFTTALQQLFTHTEILCRMAPLKSLPSVKVTFLLFLHPPGFSLIVHLSLKNILK